MALAYNVVLREAAIRVNAVAGAVSSTLNTNYQVSPLTTTEVVSSIFPLVSLQDAVLDAEEMLAKAIAETGDHPLRQYMAAQTSALSNLATLPSTSSATKPIIGIWGAVLDGSSGQICSEMPLDEVRRRATNANTQLVCPAYWYALQGGRIEHTRTTVVVECCVYSRTDQQTALSANGNVLLADALGFAYVAGTVSLLMRDDEFMLQAQAYRSYFDNAVMAIRQGLTTVTSSVREVA